MSCSILRNKETNEIERVLAPNGEDSSLFSEINNIIPNKEDALREWAKVYTPAFKSWFGDWESNSEESSKVVDTNGEPLIVYHGTANEGIDEFKKGVWGDGIYFTSDKEHANEYRLSGVIEKRFKGANLDSESGDIYPSYLNIRNPKSDSRLYAVDESKVKSEGNDGILTDSSESSALNVYGVFDPTQIKSAIDNNGDFSQDPSIYRQSKSLSDSRMFEKELNLITNRLNELMPVVVTRSEKTSARYAELLDRLTKKFGISWEEDNQQNELGRFEKGKVYLNMSKLQADTPFHEFAHPFVELVRAKNPALYKMLSARAENVTNKDGISVSMRVKELYPELSGNDLTSEIITTAIGLSAVGELKEDNASRGFKDMMKTFFNKIIEYVQSLFADSSKKIKAGDINEYTTFSQLNHLLFDTDNEVDFEGMTFEGLMKQKGDDVFTEFQNLRGQITLREEDHKYFFNGKEVKSSVHSKIIEPYMQQIYGEKEFEGKKKAFYEMLRDRGTEIHNDFQEVGRRYIDPATGLLRDNILSKDKVNTNDEIYGIVEAYLSQLLKSYEKGTRFLFEQPIYDKFTDMAGTVDFMAVTKDGKIDIKDWKSLKTSIGEDQFISDIGNIKQTAWKMQIGEYRRMIEANTGARVNSAMAIPIESNPDRIWDPEEEHFVTAKSKTIQIGDLDATKIPKELAYLAPVVTQDYKTGDADLDTLVEALYKIHSNTLKDQRPAPGEERDKWLDKLNSISETIRDLQVRRDINTILQKGNDLLYQTSLIIKRDSGEDNDAVIDHLEQINALKDEANFISNIQEYFFKMIEEDQLTKDQKDHLLRLSGNAGVVLKQLRNKELFLGKKIAENKGVSNLEQAEIKVTGLQGYLKHFSRFTNRTIRTFRKYYEDYMGKRDRRTRNDISIMEEQVKSLKEWSESKGLKMSDAYNKLLAIDQNGKVNPERLLYKYSRTFWSERESAKSKNDIAWFKKNYSFDRDGYEEAYKKQKDWETKRAEQTIEDPKRRADVVDRNMQKYESLNDIRKNENAWKNEQNRFIKIKDTNFSQEWKYLHDSSNKPLLDFYNNLISINKKAYELGMIGSLNSAPSVRASKLEQVFENGGEGAMKLLQFLDDIKAREGEGFLERDALTGQEIKRIPVLFTRSLADKLDNGEKDYSKYSRDLGKNFSLWAAHINDYEMRTNLRVIGNTMLNIEQGKKVIAKDRYGNPVKKNGEIVYEDNTGANSEILSDFVNYFVYGKAKYADSDIKIGDYSAVKAGRKMIAWMSHKTLGLNVTSAVTNLFGGTANALVELTRTGLATKKDWTQSMAELSGGNDKAKAFLALIDPLMENQTHHRINKLSMSTVNKIFTVDKLYAMMQASDKAVQNPVAIALLKNYMVHEGKLMKIRDVAKEQSSYNIDNLNMSQIRDLDKTLADKIDELKEKESLWNKASIKDGVLTSPELTDELVDEMRQITRRINKNILGSMSTEDANRVRLTTVGMFGMQFRNWMPQLVSERFKGADMDYDLNMLTEGKVVTTFNHFASKRILGLVKEALFGLSDLTLNRMHDRYAKLKQSFIDKGGNEDDFVSFSDFKDTYVGNIKSTMQEIAIMLSVIALMTAVGSVPPDDDDLKGPHKVILKTLSRMQNELSFFYDPTSFTDLVNKPFPAVGILTGVEQFATHMAKQTFYTIDGNEEGQKKAKPTKYFLQLFPVAKEGVNWIATFNDQYRKDNDIKLIH